MTIQAILFDCDGVLVDSEVLGVEVECRALARIGLDYTREAFMTRFTGLADPDFHEALEADCRTRLGTGLPNGFRQALEAEKRRLFAEQLQPIRGVAALAAALRIPRAVASSATAAELREKLEWTRLHALFHPHIYSAEQVARGKPAPDVYLFAASRLGCAPEACLVVEDSVNGVLAGVAAGMTVWGFTGGGHADPGLGERLRAAGATAVFADHDALGRHLALDAGA